MQPEGTSSELGVVTHNDTPMLQIMSGGSGQESFKMSIALKTQPVWLSHLQILFLRALEECYNFHLLKDMYTCMCDFPLLGFSGNLHWTYFDVFFQGAYPQMEDTSAAFSAWWPRWCSGPGQIIVGQLATAMETELASCKEKVVSFAGLLKKMG